MLSIWTRQSGHQLKLPRVVRARPPPTIAAEERHDFPFLDLQARQKTESAGFARFELRHDEGTIVCQDVRVVPEHQRKGLANAFYVVAELLTGFCAVPSSNKTAEGKLLWGQPNRPFRCDKRTRQPLRGNHEARHGAIPANPPTN
jgi:hypothetical protein